jgi:transcriptional regulator with XRE-family HTH domain
LCYIALFMKDRIVQLLTNESISATRLADMLGVQRSNISHILSGRNKPSFDFIEKILQKFPEISPDWLILGNGPVYRPEKSQPVAQITMQNDKEKPKTPYNDKKTAPPADLFSQPYVNKGSGHEQQIKKDADGSHSNDVTYVNKQKIIDKIVVFYSDRTFREFLPE